MPTITAKQRTKDVCALLYEISQENPSWGAPLRYAAFTIATKYRIPKSERLWEGNIRRISRPRKKKNETHRRSGG